MASLLSLPSNRRGPSPKGPKMPQICALITIAMQLTDEGGSHLGDLIEDKNAVLPIDAAIQSNLRETTTRMLASLTPREERIVRMRFLPLNGGSLQSVGFPPRYALRRAAFREPDICPSPVRQ